MVNVFLYGTLRHPVLLALVAGREVEALAPEPAELAGYRVSRAAGEDFPLIEAAPGGRTDGLLLRNLSGTVLERLDFYELSFGYELRDVSVAVGDTEVAARVYFPRPGLWQADGPFSLGDWVRAHWPLTRHAASELMSYFGRLSDVEAAARFRMIRARAAAALMAEREETPCDVRSGLGLGEVEVETETSSHIGYFLLKTVGFRHTRFDGEMSARLEREVFVAADAATVLPYDPVRDRVLLVEQFRMGPFGRGDRHPWQLEPIAGRIDGGEDAETCCYREAEEETGLRLKGLERIARYYSTPGYSSEVLHAFVGFADLPDEAARLGGAEDEHEDIRSHILDFAAAMRLIETGEANNGPLIVSLLWLARERDRLRAAAGA